MSPGDVRAVLKLGAAADLAIGVLLLIGTWDGLYDALDLPQAKPALFAQLGGAALVGLAYLQWHALGDEGLVRPVAGAAAVAGALGSGVVAIWLLFGDLSGVDTLGTVLLIAFAVVAGGLAIVQGAIATGSQDAS